MRNILIFILFLGIINASPFGLDSLNQFKGTNPKIDLSKDKKLSKKTYKELIKALNYKTKSFAIAVNTTFVAIDSYSKTIINDGDTIDILAPVQGG